MLDLQYSAFDNGSKVDLILHETERNSLALRALFHLFYRGGTEVVFEDIRDLNFSGLCR